MVVPYLLASELPSFLTDFVLDNNTHVTKKTRRDKYKYIGCVFQIFYQKKYKGFSSFLRKRRFKGFLRF